MEVRKVYKKTEVGVIPEDWGIFKLKEVTENIFSGKSKTLSTNGRYKIFGSTGVIGKSNTFDYQGIKILIARVGANAGTIYEVSGNYKVSDNTLIVEIKKKINFRFIFFILKSYNLNSLIYGSGQPLITGSLLKKLTIPLPPTVEEQKAIADALSDADELIEALDKLIVKKEAIKKGAMQELLTGKRRLPGFVGKWEEKKLGDIAKVIGGGTPSTRIDNYWNGDIPWFTPTEVGNQKYLYQSRRKITLEGLNSSSAQILKAGTILLTSRAGIGSLGILEQDACTNQGFQSLTVLKDYNNEYVYYLLFVLQSELLSRASGSTFLEISPSKVKEVPALIPPTLEEQKAIAEVLTDMDEQIDKLKIKREKAKQIKDGMMQELLTGKTRLV